MKYKNLQYKFLLLIIALLSLMNFNSAQAATSFSFDVIEGQDVSSNQFYHGRCVRADILLDTDGNSTGGADLELNYDNSRIAIVNSDCSTLATQIYHDSQFDNYVNNHVTTNKITLGSYNNPGSDYNGNGRYAYFYFTVLDGNGDYDLDFEFTLGDTTDTNLAELGTGNDILDVADSYTINFADDDNIPYVNNQNPTISATNVQVISDIHFRISDDDAGVDINTLNIALSGANWGVTNYSNSSTEVSYNCHTTNANRVDYCDVTINPSKNLYYCETYTVNITVSDLGNPTVHTLSNYVYTFDTEPDNDAPVVYSKNPNNGDTVATNSNIIFNIHDIANPGGYPGTGVDISTLNVSVSADNWNDKNYSLASYEISATPLNINDYGNVYDYNIDINPQEDFPQNTVVNVEITSSDYGCPGTDSMSHSYSFTTVDTISPICDMFSPAQNIVNMGTNENITFRCTDSGVGIDIDTFYVVVDGILYTNLGENQFSFTGSPDEYFITINPSSFSQDYALDVIINGADFSGNKINQISYGLATGVNGQCDECEEQEECEECNECDGGTGCPICKSCEVCQSSEDIICEDKKCGIKECENVSCEECTVSEEECDAKIEEKIKYKVESCDILEEVDKNKFLSASTKIPRTHLNAINLVKINDVDVHVGNKNPLHWLIKLFMGTHDSDEVIVNISDDIVIFEGNALPNSRVTLVINSEPIIITGLADDKGNWKVEIQNIFVNGIHSVSAVAVSQDNYIVHTKELVKFSVQRFNWWCIIVIVVLLISSLVLYRKYKKFKKRFEEIEENL